MKTFMVFFTLRVFVVKSIKKGRKKIQNKNKNTNFPYPFLGSRIF